MDVVYERGVWDDCMDTGGRVTQEQLPRGGARMLNAKYKAFSKSHIQRNYKWLGFEICGLYSWTLFNKLLELKTWSIVGRIELLHVIWE
jgi:hypothetical protein